MYGGQVSSQRWPRRALKLLTAVTASVVTTVALGGCSPTIAVPVASQATDPLCAMAVLNAPDTLMDLPQRQTTSQATTAWGDAGQAITLRCGVEQPGPSTECLSITTSKVTYDWIASQTLTGWIFVTYGRDPALEVRVPTAAGLEQPSAVLTDLAPAAQALPVSASCE